MKCIFCIEHKKHTLKQHTRTDNIHEQKEILDWSHDPKNPNPRLNKKSEKTML